MSNPEVLSWRKSVFDCCLLTYNLTNIIVTGNDILSNSWLSSTGVGAGEYISWKAPGNKGCEDVRQNIQGLGFFFW